MTTPKFLSDKFRHLRTDTPLHDILVSIALLAFGTVLCVLTRKATQNLLNTSFIYLMIVVAIARFTTGYLYGILASVISIMSINCFFTYPYMRINFTLDGYPIAFFSMLVISSITSATTTNLKAQTRIRIKQEKQLAIAEKEKMRANLLRAISHDLRTPLTGIIGAANLYLENDSQLDDQAKKNLICNIQEDADWLLNMVENLLSVTRINTSSAKVTKSLEPVEEVLSEAVQRLKKRLPDAQINVRIPDEFLMIPMDAVLIEQVIINLLENAVVHAKSTQPIDCYITYDDTSVSFHIRDYGTGIPEEKLPVIFDGTGTAPTDNSDSSRGMGIGLSICQTIITAHDGTITARNSPSPESEAGQRRLTPFHRCSTAAEKTSDTQGAEFCFTLPREEQDIIQTEENK